VETLASTGVLDRFLERLSASDGRALLESIGWTEGRTMHGGGDTMAPVAPHMPMHSQTVVQRWVDRWGGDVRDPRAVWLGAMLLVADRPARWADAQLPEVVRRWLASIASEAGREADEEVRTSTAAQATRRDDLIADVRTWLQSHPRSPVDSLFGGGPPFPLAQQRDATGDLHATERRANGEEPPRDDDVAEEPCTWKNPRPTEHAGFLFVISLLTRTGVADIVAKNPTLIERDWPTALLLRLARRLGIPRDDSAIAWAASQPVTIAHTDRSLSAEVLRAARIRLRMEGNLTLRQLVHRPGAIVASRANIDVLLHREELDARVHAAGLDHAPDAKAWLGRSIHFHYVDAIDLNA
jgi:hypothetical protein